MSTHEPYPPQDNGARQPGYQQPAGYQQLPSGAPNPYGYAPNIKTSEPNVSAIVLTTVTGALTVVTSFCCLPVTLAPLILGILGIVKQSTDPEGAAKMTKIGWIVFGVLSAITIIAGIGFFVWLATISEPSSPSTY